MEPENQTPQSDNQFTDQQNTVAGNPPVDSTPPIETAPLTPDTVAPTPDAPNTVPISTPAPEVESPVSEPTPPAPVPEPVAPQITNEAVPVAQAPEPPQVSPQVAPAAETPQEGQPAAAAVAPMQPLQASDLNSKKKSKLKLAIISILALGVIGGAAFGAFQLLGGKIKYSGLQTATLQGEDRDPSLSVQYADEMKEKIKTRTQVSYIHEDDKGKYSEINASGEYVGEQILGQVKEGIKIQFKEGEGSLYNLFKTEVVRAAEVKNLEIGEFRDFSSPNVKDGLIADVSFDVKAKDSEEYVPAKGRFIFVFGKQHLYTATVEAIEPVWSDNEAFFQSILDNFKVDL